MGCKGLKVQQRGITEAGAKCNEDLTGGVSAILTCE